MLSGFLLGKSCGLMCNLELASIPSKYQGKLGHLQVVNILVGLGTGLGTGLGPLSQAVIFSRQT